jgi:hypothetical protein
MPSEEKMPSKATAKNVSSADNGRVAETWKLSIFLTDSYRETPQGSGLE